MTTHKPSSLLVGFIGGIVLLGAMYAGCYYAMVKAWVVLIHPAPPASPSYSIGRHEWKFGQIFFAPTHQIDRRLRPGTWDPKP